MFITWNREGTVCLHREDQRSSDRRLWTPAHHGFRSLILRLRGAVRCMLCLASAAFQLLLRGRDEDLSDGLKRRDVPALGVPNNLNKHDRSKNRNISNPHQTFGDFPYQKKLPHTQKNSHIPKKKKTPTVWRFPGRLP